jgi:hypothetical protein
VRNLNGGMYMNFDYIGMIGYVEINQFITKVLTARYQTNLLVKPNNMKISSVAQEIEFEAVLSNGKYVTGKAICTDFQCKILINDKTEIYTNEWAKHMFNILKSKEDGKTSRVSEIYKADYNDYCAKVRDAKHSEAEQEFENSLLR